MPNQNVIILFTPIHTGTHFVRMLLESHPAIAPAIEEDFRVDRRFRPDHVLKGNGKGAKKNDYNRETEPMVVEYFRGFLRGASNGEDFQKVLAYWHTISAQTTSHFNNHDFHLNRAKKLFKEFRIPFVPKTEEFLLYRGHAHENYLNYDLLRLENRFPLVVTIRHPLYTILTILRRHMTETWESNINDYFAALKCVFSFSKAFVFCTDLWQATPEKMEGLLPFLGLTLHDSTRRYISLRPRINHTVTNQESNRTRNFVIEKAHAPSLIAKLAEAKDQLQHNRLHPCLAPYWKRICDLNLVEPFERHGYQFDF
ncbi:MAG: hypothetical protein SGI77_00155 [Pirellulaceae bacterium]|nr:hypothetical protein [Pirellulaceae bacterium]